MVGGGASDLFPILRRPPVLPNLDTKRVKLLTQLRMMGFRSRGLVDEHGELLAAALYSAPLPAV